MAAGSLAPFRHRDFALFWTGAFVSNVGTWMETVALGYYVADQTRQAAWSAVIAAAGFVPTAVLGPVGGALADRYPRRRIIIGTTAVMAALAAVLAGLVAADRATPVVIAVLTLGTGCVAAIGFPAYLATIPDLVPEDELPAATGLGSAQFNLGRIIGPVAAAAVISLGGVSTALVVNAVSFLAVIAAVGVIRLPLPRPDAVAVPMREAIPEGARFVRQEPGLRATFVLMCTNTLLAAPFIALIPAMAVKVLDGDETTTSILVTAQGVGAVTAGFTVGAIARRLGQRGQMVTAMSLMPVALALYGLAPTIWVMAPALAVLGALYLGALNSFTTVAQLRSPARLRGRVLAVNNAVLGALYPLGALVQGRLGDIVGLRTITVAAAVVLALVLLAGRALRPGFTRPLDHPALVPA
jgi:MFS family permease